MDGKISPPFLKQLTSSAPDKSQLLLAPPPTENPLSSMSDLTYTVTPPPQTPTKDVIDHCSSLGFSDTGSCIEELTIGNPKIPSIIPEIPAKSFIERIMVSPPNISSMGDPFGLQGMAGGSNSSYQKNKNLKEHEKYALYFLIKEIEVLIKHEKALNKLKAIIKGRMTRKQNLIPKLREEKKKRDKMNRDADMDKWKKDQEKDMKKSKDKFNEIMNDEPFLDELTYLSNRIMSMNTIIDSNSASIYNIKQGNYHMSKKGTCKEYKNKGYKFIYLIDKYSNKIKRQKNIIGCGDETIIYESMYDTAPKSLSGGTKTHKGTEEDIKKSYSNNKLKKYKNTNWIKSGELLIRKLNNIENIHEIRNIIQEWNKQN